MQLLDCFLYRGNNPTKPHYFKPHVDFCGVQKWGLIGLKIQIILNSRNGQTTVYTLHYTLLSFD